MEQTQTADTLVAAGHRPAPKPLYQDLAALVYARRNCAERTPPNAEWFARHTDAILQLVKDHMPSGSGIDSGTELDLERSTPDKLVFATSFHHMDEGGGYDGWTDHTITVRASLWTPFQISVSGRNRNDIKDYLAECFDYALHQTVQR